MLIEHHREKLINAIIFFSSNTNNLGKIKLWKLLYLFDFQHYQETGRSVTGLDYFAWPKGPVPKELHNEMSAPREDLLEKIDISRVPYEKGEALTFTAKKEFDSKNFSKRELRLLNSLSSEFRNTNSDQMIERTHLENEPWYKIFKIMPQEVIPYQLAIKDDELDAITSLADERAEIILNYTHL